jgi:transposase InsO family protein
MENGKAKTVNQVMKMELPIFNGKNYAEWAEIAKLVIQSLGVKAWQVILGTVPALAADATAAVREAREELISNVRITLLYGLGNEYRTPYLETQDPKVIWDKLKAQFERIKQNDIHSMNTDLFNLRLEEGGDFDNHLNKMEGIFCKLKSAGAEMAEGMRLSILYHSLPPAYGTTISNLHALAHTDTVVTFDLAKGHITNYYRDHIKNAIKPSGGLALTTRRDGDGGSSSANRGGHSGRDHHHRHQSNSRGNRGGNRGSNRGGFGGRNRHFGHNRGHQGHNRGGQGHNHYGNQDQSPNINVSYCLICKMRNHDTLDCRQLLNAVRRKGGNSNQGFALAVFMFNTYTLPPGIKDPFIYDSGASQHMCPNKLWFHSLTPLSPTVNVYLGDNTALEATGVGQLIVLMRLPSGKATTTVNNVLFVPKLMVTLISLSVVAKTCNTLVTDTGIEVYYRGDNSLIATGRLIDHLYYLDADVVMAPTANAATTSDYSAITLHKKLGHMSHQRITETLQITQGLEKYSRDNIDEKCESCILAKQHRSVIPKTAATHRAIDPLTRIHSDYCGPYATRSKGGANGVILFMDDYSRFPEVIYTTAKSQVAPVFKTFVLKYETKLGRKVKILRSDSKGEYTGHEMVTFCEGSGIKQELAAPHSQFQDGVAERFFQTFNEMVRVFLTQANMPHSFWAEAGNIATWILRRVHTKALSGVTPIEAFLGEKPDFSYLHTFGCKAWAYIHGRKPKLADRSALCIYLSPTENPGTHKLYNPSTQKFITSRDVIFDDSSFFYVEKLTNRVRFNSPDSNKEFSLLVCKYHT